MTKNLAIPVAILMDLPGQATARASQAEKGQVMLTTTILRSDLWEPISPHLYDKASLRILEPPRCHHKELCP